MQLDSFHLLRHQDENTSAAIMVITSTQWLSVRMTTACSLMIAAAAIGAVLVTQSPGNVAPFFRVSKMRCDWWRSNEAKDQWAVKS